MEEYQLKISGVHYGANGDFVIGQKDTEEDHVRTREMLSWLEREKPRVVLAAESSNPIHKDAIVARALGRRIGRVAYECVELAQTLLRQSGQQMILAKVSEVAVKNHGYVVVTVDADDLPTPKLQPTDETKWKQWTKDMPLLPPSEQLQKEEEAAFVLDKEFMPNLDGADIKELKLYIDLWIDGARHDLSREAQEKRASYIDRLEASQIEEVRLLADELKEQRAKLCERAMLDEHATVWWDAQIESNAMQRLREQWRLKNNRQPWLGLKQLDALLRQLPDNLYYSIGQRDELLSRLYYMNTPLKAFQIILALMMLRELICRELGIDMHPMTETEYDSDGRITNPLDIPTTLGRIVEYGDTYYDKNQRQAFALLAHWLKDDYEQRHTPEIDSLLKEKQQPQVKIENANINGALYDINGNTDVHIGG